MKRLSERSDPTSPIEATAIALLRSTRRFEVPQGMKQRVRARLLSSRPASATGLFRPALVAMSLLLAAGASAALGGSWLRQDGSGAPENQLNRGKLLAGGSASHDKQALTPASIPSSSTPSPPDVERAQSPIASVGNPPTVGKLSAPAKGDTVGRTVQPTRPTEATRASEPTSEPSAKEAEVEQLVFDSMRALRRDGQPERATKQLDDYLNRYPDGALAEEALALSIEAATLRGDPRAKELAQRYLARYPRGRFKKAAERARTRFSP